MNNQPDTGKESATSPAAEEVTEMKDLLRRKDEELADTAARLRESEEALAGHEGTIAGLNRAKTELEERIVALTGSLHEAVTSYRTLLVESTPGLPGELVTGDSVESVNASAEKAKELVGRVREDVEAEFTRSRIPAGAPERGTANLTALSPREKIQYAIGQAK